jgi:hypothetical protein
MRRGHLGLDDVRRQSRAAPDVGLRHSLSSRPDPLVPVIVLQTIDAGEIRGEAMDFGEVP